MEAARGGKGAGEPRIRVSLEPDPALRHSSYVLAAGNEDMQARSPPAGSLVWQRCQPDARRHPAGRQAHVSAPEALVAAKSEGVHPAGRVDTTMRERLHCYSSHACNRLHKQCMQKAGRSMGMPPVTG